jgi:hypothetical protein
MMGNKVLSGGHMKKAKTFVGFNIAILMLVLMITLPFIVSCGTSDSNNDPAPDSDDSQDIITVQVFFPLSNPAIQPNEINFQNAVVVSNLGDTDCNAIDLSLFDSFILANQTVSGACTTGASIVSVGPVDSLESITAIPATPYPSSVSLIKGHGYVVLTGTPGSDSGFYRLRFEDFVIDDLGFIIGIKIRYSPI